MTVYEFYKKAERFYMLNDDASNVLMFFKEIENTNLKLGRPASTCGLCANRKTKVCPWPDKSDLLNNPCLDFTLITQINNTDDQVLQNLD